MLIHDGSPCTGRLLACGGRPPGQGLPEAGTQPCQVSAPGEAAQHGWQVCCRWPRGSRRSTAAARQVGLPHARRALEACKPHSCHKITVPQWSVPHPPKADSPVPSKPRFWGGSKARRTGARSCQQPTPPSPWLLALLPPHRTVEEIYAACELDGNLGHAQATLRALQDAVDDFNEVRRDNKAHLEN